MVSFDRFLLICRRCDRSVPKCPESGARRAGQSLCQHHLHKFLVVYVALSILLALYEELHLLLVHLLPQACQQVPQLNRRDATIALLVKVLQSLHKVVSSVSQLPPADSLQKGQEGLKGEAGVRTSCLA